MDSQRDLERRHPDYDRMLKRWILEHDFYRGGYHVLKPASYSDKVWWLNERRPDDDGSTSSKPERPASVYEWIGGTSNSYLHKHPRERKQSWDSRQARAWHLPLFRPTVNIFASAVLKTGPRRDASSGWRPFLEDVDLNGTAIDAFTREALTMALVFGRYHSIVDMTTPEDAVVTQRQQDESGVRPYAYHVSPMDLVNWSLDENGRYRWIQVREDAPDERLPGDEWPDAQNQYRIWTPSEWFLYRKQTTRTGVAWVRVESGSHPVGRVPMPSVYAHRGSRVILGCESPFCDVADTDRSVFNKLSLLDELLYKQTFSILAVGRREGSPMADSVIAPDMAFVYDAEAGPPSYVAPDAAQVLALWRVIGDTVGLIRMQSEAGRSAASEQSSEARSAAAIGAEQGDRNNVMSSLAESTEAYERDLYDCAARWSGKSDAPSASYPRKFDLRTVNQAIADLVQVKQLQVGQRVLATLTEPILVQLLKEAGATQSAIDDMVGELSEQMEEAEENAEPEPPRPQFGDGSRPSADEQAMRRADA